MGTIIVCSIVSFFVGAAFSASLIEFANHRKKVLESA
jgi:hypothetical protein